MPVRARAVDHLPFGDGRLDRRGELVTEELVDAPDGAHGVDDQLAVVHIEEALLAERRTRGDRLLHTDAQVLAQLATETLQVALAHRPVA